MITKNSENNCEQLQAQPVLKRQ